MCSLAARKHDGADIDKDFAKMYNIIGMKTDKKIKALILAPVIIGLILIVIGIVSQNTGVLYAGIIVLFGGSGVAAFITVAITVISMKRGNSENADGSSVQDGETNSADGKARHSDTGKKVFSALFVLAFLGCLIGGMVLLSVGYIAVGVTVFACSFLLIIGAIIISTARARMSRSKASEKEKYTLRIAEVNSCEACSSVTVMGMETSCKYMVWLTIDGKQYSAKSRESYYRGDRLKVLLHENGEKVKIVEKTSADDEKNIESGKHSAVRAAQKKLTDRDKEYRDKIEDELTHLSEQLLEMDNVITHEDIDELVDRELEIEMEYLESDETDEDFDKYEAKRRLLYDEMRRKFMNNPPLDGAFDEPEPETSFDEQDGKAEPESDTPNNAEPTDAPPIVPSYEKEPETPTEAEKAADVTPDIKASVAAEENSGSTEPETPFHATAEPARPTRQKRVAVGYKGIKKK